MRTKKNNRYIKRASLRRVKKHKRMYGGEVQILYSLDELNEYITKYINGSQCDLFIQVLFEKNKFIEGNDDYYFPLIEIARKLNTLYNIITHHWADNYTYIPNKSVSIDACLQEQTKEEKRFNENKEINREVYNTQKELHKKEWEKYNDYVVRKREYDEQIIKWRKEPTKVDIPTIKKPVLQEKAGKICSIQIYLKPIIKYFENINLSKIAEDYTKTLNIGHEETIETNVYLKLKYYFETDPHHNLISFHIGFCK